MLAYYEGALMLAYYALMVSQSAWKLYLTCQHNGRLLALYTYYLYMRSISFCSVYKC